MLRWVEPVYEDASTRVKIVCENENIFLFSVRWIKLQNIYRVKSVYIILQQFVWMWSFLMKQLAEEIMKSLRNEYGA